MARIGIYGGTFNPPHNGHIETALRFAEALGLSKIYLIPTAAPPHKDAPELADGEDRLAMCRLAAREHPVLSVSDTELRRGGKSYTVDTLLEFTHVFPDDELYLLMGADMFVTLETWRRFEVIARLAVLCAVARGNTGYADLCEYARRIGRRYGAKTKVITAPLLPESSTDVRVRLFAGESADDALPAPVAQYIREKNLYAGG